jgi:pilus assembly protein CpaC
MLFDHTTRLLKFMAGISGCAIALALALAAVATPRAYATDYSQPTSSEEGHFVRIGLGKSIVIRLPADARDVIVGDPTIVDAVVRTKHTAYLFARAVGQTNIFFFDADGRQIMNIDLEVALDMKALQKLIHRTSPRSRITVDTVGGNVVLNGVAANAVEAKLAEDLAAKFAGDPAKVVNAMKIAEGDQVMLKVRVVEINRTVLKELGVNIEQLAFDVGKFAFNLSSINPVFPYAHPLTGPFGGGGNVSGSSNGVDFSSTFRALESEGLVHTLAEPNLSAVSGAPARFHAGGELPYETCKTTEGFRDCTVTFRSIGVSLDFTPVVLSEGRISLKIKTEVSERGSDAVGIFPTIDSRQAETTVEIPSGGSMVMAGLIKNVTKQQLDGTPGMKNLPVLGALFRSRQFQQDMTELAVIVTPYVVNPVHESQLATPTDRLNVPTDRQTILFGRLNKIYGTADRHPDGVYHGNVGFIIE